jgi:hypothetical protein
VFHKYNTSRDLNLRGQPNQDEPFHVHIEESHFPKSPFGLGHAVHNFHPHAHGELGEHIPDFFAPLAPKGAPGFAGKIIFKGIPAPTFSAVIMS